MTSTHLLKRLAAATLAALSITLVVSPSQVSASTSIFDFDESIKKVFLGENSGDYFGREVKNIGDVNGDGYDDLGVGARGYDGGSSNEGAFYIILGRSDLYTDQATASLIRFYGENTNDFTGHIFAAAGDVNGDGFDDILVGSPNSDDPAQTAGAAYLIYGRSTFNTENNLSAEVQFTGEAAYDYAGASVAGAGDVDGDGYDDFLINATNEDGETGSAYLFYGKESAYTSASLSTGVEFSLSADFTFFGYKLDGVGDTNGDGYADFAVSSIYGDSNENGIVHLIYGQESRFVDQEVTEISVQLEGENSGNEAGTIIRGLGDMNSDGYDDFAVHASQYNSGKGAIYIIYGSAEPLTSGSLGDHVRIMGAETTSGFGQGISSADDLNGDGYNDILVRGSAAALYVIYGQPTELESQDSSNLLQLTNAQYAELIDLNGDGVTDTVFGTSTYSTNFGIVRIFYGGQWSISLTTDTSEVNTIECGIESFTSPGATATDPYTGEAISISTSGTVTNTATGTYTLTYTGSDLLGISDSATRTVTVEDTTVPTVTVIGESSVELTTANSYTESGATVTDACDTTVEIVTTGSVDTDTPGTYTITYTATDASNNSTTATRTVTIEEATVEVKTDGKFVRVFVDGELSTRKKIANKKLAKKYRKIKTAKVYKGKNYKTVTVVAARKKKVTVTTFRLTPNNTLTKKQVRTFDYNKRNRVSVSYKPKKKRIVVKIGKNMKMVTKTYKLTKKGRLKKV